MPLFTKKIDAEFMFEEFSTGNQRGLENIYKLLYRPVLNFCGSIVESAEICEEIIEESFVKLWQHRDKIPNYKALVSYLYTIVRNASFTYLTSSARHKSRLADFAYVSESVTEAADAAIIRAELLRLILLESSALPPKTKVVFEKIFLDGKAVSAIAGELGLSISTIKNQKQIGIKKIRAALLKKGITDCSLFFL